MGTATGKVGLVVFRDVRGKLVAANRPPRGQRTATSVKQQAVVKRFKKALLYAKAALDDPTRKALYTARVGGSLYTPRLVAMSDYLNPPVIDNIDVSAYKGAVGDVITIDAEDNFQVTRVQVIILSGGVVIETGDAAEDKLNLVWRYAATAAATPGSITLRVTAYDTPGNATTVEKAV